MWPPSALWLDGLPAGGDWRKSAANPVPPGRSKALRVKRVVVGKAQLRRSSDADRPLAVLAPLPEPRCPWHSQGGRSSETNSSNFPPVECGSRVLDWVTRMALG